MAIFCALKTSATSYTWIGTASGNWTNPNNWLPLAPAGGPGAGDDITIGITANNLTVDNSGISCNSITFTSGATLNLTNALTITGAVTINAAGTVNFTGGTSLTAGALAVVNGAIIAGSGTLTFTTLTVGAGNTFTTNNGPTLIFNGAVAVNGTYTSNAATTFNNTATINSTGTFTNNSFITISGTLNIAARGTFTNKGTLTSGTGSQINLNDNTAAATPLVNVNPGTIAATGATFNLGAFTTFSNGGVVTCSNCTFNLNGTSAIISNGSTYTDNGSTYYLNGTNSKIQNSRNLTTTACLFNFVGKGARFMNKAGGAMHLSGSTVNMSTNANMIISNLGTFTADGSSIITVATKNSTITNSGTFYAGKSGSSCLITLSGQGASITNTGTFYLGSTSVIFPPGDGVKIDNSAGTSFTLQSDTKGSAAIAAFATNATCLGNFNVERYVQGYRGYRLMSSPVYAANVNSRNVYSINYIKNNAVLTGTTDAAGGFDKAGNPTIYIYRQDIPSSNASYTSGNFRGINNILSAPNYNIDGDGGPFNIPLGSGFLFFFRGERAGHTAAEQTVTTYVATASTLTATGSINVGDVPVNLWYGGSDLKTAITGYTLIGNPYPCSINLDGFSTGTIVSTGLRPVIYVMNPQTKNYNTYNTFTQIPSGATSNIIASGQGFFVEADPTASTASVKFTEAAKAPLSQPTATLGGSLLMGTPLASAYAVRQILRLKLSVDSLNYDDIAIAFNSNSSSRYNDQEDSRYLSGMSGVAEGLASFSSDSIPVPLSVNFLPLPKKAQEVIKLKVDATNSGRFTLSKTSLDELPKLYEIWLMDKYKKDSLDLRHNSDYVFDINKSDPAASGNDRFQIIVRQNTALGVHLLDFTATKQPSEVPLTWVTENEESYTNFTVERSTDNGITFNVLGGFASNGQGTYTFTDKNPVNTVDIYRLKIEDLNGAITYSKAITVVYDPSKVVAVTTKVSVYPNPSSGVINLAIGNTGYNQFNLSGIQKVGLNSTLASAASGPSASYGIKIISVTGSVIKTATSSSPTWQDNVSTLLPGTYFIQVVNNSDNSLVGKSSFVKL